MSKSQFLSDNLLPGEVYAGLILGQNGEQDYHLFATLGDHPKLNWKDAIALTEKANLALPNRRELRLLWVNAKQHFQEAWYWSGQQRAGGDSYAWCQDFANGGQYGTHKDGELRVVLVRRVPIKG